MNNHENTLHVSHANLSESATSYGVAFVMRNFRVLALFTLFGGLLGFSLTFFIAKEWEASALIRVGQLGKLTESVMFRDNQLKNKIEPTLQVVDRLKSKSFQIDLLKQVGPSSGTNHNIDEFSKKFKVRLEKSDLISITLRSDSALNAKIILNNAVNQLKSNHAKMMAPTINRWHQELALIDKELKVVSMQRNKLLELSTSQVSVVSDKNLLQAALLGNVLVMRENEIHTLFERKRLLEEQLSVTQTFPTEVLGRIETNINPVFPVKLYFLLVGLLVGFMSGLLAAFFKSKSLFDFEKINQQN